MAYLLTRQVDVQHAQTQGPLVITHTTASQAYVGMRLVAEPTETATAFGPGYYECLIPVNQMTDLDVTLKPSAVTGSTTPAIRAMYWNNIAYKSTTNGAAFVADTAQVLSVTNLKGVQRVKIVFTVPGGGSVTFDNSASADPVVDPDALAEFNGF